MRLECNAQRSKAIAAALLLALTIRCASADAGVSIVQGVVGGVSTATTQGEPSVFSGAKICFDLNGNGVCDPGEPSTTSSATGYFKLASKRPAPLVAEIGTAASNGGYPIAGRIAFRAHLAQVRAATRNPLLPATVNLTPLSTEIAQSIDSQGLTEPAALAGLAHRLGVDNAANLLLAPTQVIDSGDQAAIVRESALAQRRFSSPVSR